MLAPYAASKQFLASFAAAIGAELKGKGVDVELVNTYFVVSNMSKIRKPTMLIPTPRPYVKAVLAKVGLKVRELERVAIGPLKAGTLKLGQAKLLGKKDIERLRASTLGS